MKLKKDFYFYSGVIKPTTSTPANPLKFSLSMDGKKSKMFTEPE